MINKVDFAKYLLSRFSVLDKESKQHFFNSLILAAAEFEHRDHHGQEFEDWAETIAESLFQK